jgi:adenosine deaminase
MVHDRSVASPEYLRALPKAEFHCHLEGSVPATTAVSLARRNGVKLRTADPDVLYQFDTFEEFLDVYVAVSAAMTTPRDFAEVAYDCLTDAQRTGNLRYREMSFNPTNHPSLTYPQMLEGLLDGLRSAQADTGVECRLIVAINREQSPSVARDLVADVIAHRCDEVVAIGIDHNERAGAPAEFVEAYRAAAAAGLHRTAHAGERGDSQEVRDSIELLGVERIDHGYAVLSDPDLVTSARSEGIHFATCWSTGLLHHGGDPAAIEIGPMIAAGLSVSINSDDPPMFNTDIGTEFVLAGQSLSLTRDQAADLARAGLDSAFVDDTDRSRLHKVFAAEIERLDRELDGHDPTD